jgi:hypothetical protein
VAAAGRCLKTLVGCGLHTVSRVMKGRSAARESARIRTCVASAGPCGRRSRPRCSRTFAGPSSLSTGRRRPRAFARSWPRSRSLTARCDLRGGTPGVARRQSPRPGGVPARVARHFAARNEADRRFPDAGFYGAFFREISRLGWDFVVRVRGHAKLRFPSGGR